MLYSFAVFNKELLISFFNIIMYMYVSFGFLFTQVHMISLLFIFYIVLHSCLEVCFMYHDHVYSTTCCLHSSCWSVLTLKLECAFFYVPCPLIDWAPRNDTTSLTTYTTHTRTSDTNIYIYIYSLNSLESNYRYALRVIKILICFIACSL